MKIDLRLNKIFRNGSTTYFNSSLFFPKKIRTEITKIYAFVRTADDFVDKIPQDKTGFLQFKKEALFFINKNINEIKKSSKTQKINPIIYHFIETANTHNFDSNWTKDFLWSMEQDIKKSKYNTYKELEKYIYGSAEVIGLYIAKLLKLEHKSYKYAMLQGKSMQLINFIRDIKEDIDLNRQYIPTEDLQKFKLNNLSYSKDDKVNDQNKKESLKELIRFELNRFYKIQKQAEQGYKYIPYKYKIAIATAADMYKYTAKIIEKNPLIIFEKKVKPNKFFVIFTACKNIIKLAISEYES